ncbi:hypothetical protein [Chryseobacterium sp. BIGb0232]|uniref:hypothetical protein n=1 Tax=Chryseobacterium sp. BIGb0232 TaxID=2940598 RepID=UPI000F47BA8C|nr:hypothetical protein [Chryseobacterium sp. BIGb0232]MCS4303383.1 S-adenosylmethionine synthetase [Chryseobacterium sp. BIGb0232]ROS11346.1 hypothetical protein EDF65_3753 [Chryseobacterium nakagawai]
MEDEGITILDIRKLINILSDKLEKLDDKEVVKLEDDLYWNILDEELYNPYDEPAQLTMGSLTEDWEFLQNVLNREREIIDYDLYKLASILKFLGKKGMIT